jgi:hypothetical protein
MRYAILLVVTCLATNSCAHRLAFGPSAPHLDETRVLKWLSAQSAGAAFVSHNGRMYGTDCDAKITLERNKQVEVTEYGFAVQTYRGTCSVDATGAIHLELRNYHAKWPAMYLYNSPNGTFLFPTDKDPEFRVNRRTGAVETSGTAPSWPFRKTK